MREPTWNQICARRLHRHFLDQSGERRPAAVAAALVGAHAQMMSAAELAIGLRGGGSPGDVRDALWKDQTLVKTFGPRGTVHLLPVRDLPMWTGALSALPARQGLAPDARLTPEQSERVLEVLDGVLRAGEYTVDELTGILADQAGPWAADPVMPAFQTAWPRWRQIVGVAAHRGLLCFGPNRGRNVTYTSPHRWLPRFTPLPGEQALARLVHDYLRSYGPATPSHFARWLAVPKSFAAKLFSTLGDELEQVSVAGEAAYVVAGDSAFPEPGPAALRLLPHFDPYGIGCQPRELLFPGPAWQRGLGGGQAGTLPLVLVGGVVAGVWHHRRAGRRLAVTVELFDQLPAQHRRELDAEVAQVGELLDVIPELTLGPVTAGHHA
jgi:Winged helix DNA-binding domain